MHIFREEKAINVCHSCEHFFRCLTACKRCFCLRTTFSRPVANRFMLYWTEAEARFVNLLGFVFFHSKANFFFSVIIKRLKGLWNTFRLQKWLSCIYLFSSDSISWNRKGQEPVHFGGQELILRFLTSQTANSPSLMLNIGAWNVSVFFKFIIGKSNFLPFFLYAFVEGFF